MKHKKTHSDSILTRSMGIGTRREVVAFELGINGLDVFYQDDSHCKFMHNEKEVTFFYRSMWFTGKSVNDGRGLKVLINQITKKQQ
jgi:hypothetical protein